MILANPILRGCIRREALQALERNPSLLRTSPFPRRILSALEPIYEGNTSTLAEPIQQRNFSTAPKLADESSHLFKEIQKEFWDSYLATGRGSTKVFSLIDSNHDGKLSPEDVRFFVDGIDYRGINDQGIEELWSKVADHEITLPEFQNWLIRATKFDISEKNVINRPLYDAQLGEKRYAPQKTEYSWNASTMSQSLRRMQYAVRGEVVMKADALKSRGRDIVFTNIGNPHAVGQRPITFYREVLALCDLPAEYGVDHPIISKSFPSDVVARAKEMRGAIGPAGTGAYTNSQGVLAFREDVADFISARDGHPAHSGNIFLTNGASSGIEMVLTGLISDDSDAIMIPIPQYPIYSALIDRLGARKVGYYLDESAGWTVSLEELEGQLETARAEGLNVKAMALINPGNPTGQVLTRKDLELVCQFCAKNQIVLLADEVYQRNVYVEDKQFISAKKVALETPGCETLQLISFHSTSKGLIGECGRRGGYMELHHIDPYVQSQLYKLASSGLCSGVAGQIMTSLMLRPPKEGEPSYELFKKEEDEIYDSLKRRAEALVDGLNSIPGITCLRVEGAMYAFPRVELPEKALQEAKDKQMSPDTLYALSLLEETGICVVPASGFGQAKGRVGFRTTFLPPEEDMKKAILEFKRHHELFCDKYT